MSRAGMCQVGIDEAGRGSVLGPLVVAGVALEEEDVRDLVEMGVDDSKKLAPSRRETLAIAIRNRALGIAIRIADPAAIDGCRTEGGLDVLEARLMAEIVVELGVLRVVVDAPGPGGRLFGKRLLARLGEDSRVQLVAENKADERYGVVAAASILAKTTRDASIRELAATHGAIGSGYPSDPETVLYLEERARRGEGPPAFARRSWGTLRRIYGPRQLELFS